MVLRVEVEEDEVMESESDEVVAQCRAQWTDELELELEDDDEEDEVDATDSGRRERDGEGGRGGGSPR
ncbi:hypothetical protein PsYK624_022380 [Phanerochaete sordida]|uniref:Uncharacterized protein n=1 Tax=Phanerochaete sordida TaxID=48140 RepID=A0A9P3L9N8_9APHY|nr:hypothetical protein PsYK624_022380 [Phanerochaete sordida]